MTGVEEFIRSFLSVLVYAHTPAIECANQIIEYLNGHKEFNAIQFNLFIRELRAQSQLLVNTEKTSSKTKEIASNHAKTETDIHRAEEAARKRVSGAFGKGAQMTGNKGTAASGTGTEGSKEGNSSTGAKTGTGGYGTFDLGGRSLGTGSLPKPAYNVQEEGRVVVNITVNPAGQVVSTSISPQTNTVNSALRKAAEDAAKKARFNTIDGVNNQTGTITYYFNLR